VGPVFESRINARFTDTTRRANEGQEQKMNTKEGVLISQAELQEIYELQRELISKQNHLEELKSNVKTLLIGKVRIQSGRFMAHLITIPGRNVPWKQVVVEELGADFAETCRKRFPVRVRFDVKVEEHAIVPLWKNDSGGIEVN
jgi:hypothetical protein